MSEDKKELRQKIQAFEHLYETNENEIIKLENRIEILKKANKAILKDMNQHSAEYVKAFRQN